jgi:hypothetical protein
MRNFLRLGLGSAALVFSVLPVWSEVQPEGRELRVNGQLGPQQRNPVAAFAGTGSSAVVWESESKGLRAVFYVPDGRASGEVALVANQSLPGVPASGETMSRIQPAAAFLPSGELALAWVEERAFVRVDYFIQDRKVLDRKIAFQRFTAGGQPIGSAVLLDATATGFQQEPRIALLAGKILVVWEAAEGGGLSGRLLNAAGRPIGDQIAIAGVGATGVALATSRNHALVTWQAADGNDTGIFGQILDAAGAPVGSSFRVNSTTEDRQRRAAVTTGPDGGFFVLWQSRSHATAVTEERIFGQLVGAAGNLVGAQFQVDAGAESGYVQMAPAVAPAPGGHFLATWLAWPNNNAGLEIAGREIDMTGQAVGGLFWLTEQRIERNYRKTSLATDGAGHYLMPWETIRQRSRVISARRLVDE